MNTFSDTSAVTRTVSTDDSPKEGFPLDRGEATTDNDNKREGREITPQAFEPTVDDVSERGKDFDTTGLGNQEQVFLDEKTRHTTEKLKHVQSPPPLGESGSDAAARIEKKFLVVFDNLMRNMISAREKFPELLTKLSHSLQHEEQLREQIEALQTALEQVQELKQNVRGIAQVYFSKGVRMLREYALAYKEGFSETMKPRIEEYYLRFGHNTQHVPSVNSFADILVTDIEAITTGAFGHEGSLTLEEIEEKLQRLIQLYRQKEVAQSRKQTSEQVAQNEEAEEIRDELAENAQAAAASLPENSSVDQSDHAQTA